MPAIRELDNAGGLTPNNVSEAIRQVRPYAVDGFGASDRRCKSHLFFLKTAENTEQIVESAGLLLKAQYVDRSALTGDR